MSNAKNTILIEPQLVACNDDTEHFKFGKIECPSCEGNGYHVFLVGYHGSSKEKHSEICMRCNGTGKLMADVVVRWMPDKKEVDHV